MFSSLLSFGFENRPSGHTTVEITVFQRYPSTLIQHLQVVENEVRIHVEVLPSVQRLHFDASQRGVNVEMTTISINILTNFHVELLTSVQRLTV